MDITSGNQTINWKRKVDRGMKMNDIFMSIYLIDNKSKIGMNTWKRYWKYRPSPMRNLFFASDNWPLHFLSTVM